MQYLKRRECKIQWQIEEFFTLWGDNIYFQEFVITSMSFFDEEYMSEIQKKIDGGSHSCFMSFFAKQVP